MYNAHRGMGPNPQAARFNEIIEQMRGEFDLQMSKSGEYEHKYIGQIAEMELMQRSVYQLEAAHNQMKQKYEEEIARLTRELEARGGHVPPHGVNAGPAQPQPPSIGHGVGSLFGGIMAGQGQNGPGLAPPVPQEHPQQHQQVPHQPLHAPPPIQQGPLPPQPPQQQYQQPGFGGPSNGYNDQRPPPPSSSPGPGKNRGRPIGPATPQQPQPPPAPYSERASPAQIARPSPAVVPVGNNLGDVDPANIPPNQKKEGSDWFVYFNPRVQRVLDVDLVHTLDHNSVVCCVRFSQDGKFVATGCNRSAQIFDVVTGRRVTILQDETVDREGDLYIRSVCFSPDGRYLATGAEDKQIRVWDIASKTIKHNFTGHDQDIYSLDFSRNGRHIASGSGDRTVRLWDMDTGNQMLTLSIEDGVTTVAISPDGRYVAAGSLDKSVRVWDVNTGVLVERLEGPDGHKDSVYSVAFAPNGRDLVSGSLDKTIKMWELNSNRPGGSAPRGGTCIRTFDGHRDFVLSVALTPDGKWVLSGSKDRGVQFWDPLTGSTQLMLQGHKNSVISVAPSPTGRLFATGSGDMRARIWSYDPHNPNAH